MVVDANILVRAVLGSRVLPLLKRFAGKVDFYAPDQVFAEALAHLPDILKKRQVEASSALYILESLAHWVQKVELSTYKKFESIARRRLSRRDEDDWPILATALAMKCPIWTEDTDFFGCGVATWTTDRIDIYLQEKTSPLSR